MSEPSLSVFFPCHNERENVERVTLAAIEATSKITSDYEIIIVDDGSTDGTSELADQLAAAHSNVRVVHNRPNRGYGGALQTGFKAATKPLVFYADGDGQFDFNEIPKVLALLDRYDIVSGYRENRQDGVVRRLNAWGWTTVCNLLLGLRLRDIDGAFKVFPRKLFDEIEMQSEGALIDAEVLAKARRRGYTIGQVGVSHYPRTAGEASGASIGVILKAFRELFKLRKHIVRDA